MCNSSTDRHELEEAKWGKKKQKSQLLSESLYRLRMDKMAERVADCGSYLVFAECPDGHERRLRKAYFCKSRLCSMCIWRKSLATYHQAYQMCHHALEREPDLNFIFLTLTVRNVEAEELRDSITQLTQGFDRLMKLRGWKKHIAGYMRSIEITRNKNKRSKDYGTYHPHIHIILAVYPSYFKSGYKTKKQVAQLWRDSVRINYDPVIDIRKVKPKKKREKYQDWDDDYAEVKKTEHNPLISGAVAEVSKYSVEENSFIDENDEDWTDSSVATLLASLHRKRLIAYGGILRDIRKELNMKDVDVDADLVNVTGEEKTCTCSVCNSDFLDIAYSWLGDKYVGKKHEAFDRDELINKNVNKRNKYKKAADEAKSKVQAWKTEGASSDLKTKKVDIDFKFKEVSPDGFRDEKERKEALERMRKKNSEFTWEEYWQEKEREWSTPGASSIWKTD